MNRLNPNPNARKSKRSFPMAWLLMPLFVMAGYLIGGVGPRGELEKLRAELQWRQARPQGGGRQTLNVITDVVRIPSDSTRRSETTALAPESGEDLETDQPAEPGNGNAPTAETPENEPPPEINFAEQLAAAREAWALRSEVARSSLVARTDMTAAETAQFDVLVAAMNLRLTAHFENLASLLAAGESLTPETGVRAVNNLTGALTLTYDELDRKLSPEWRATAGEDFDLTDFVDPAVAEPLLSVEDQLTDNPAFRQRRRRR